ncbi:hypothetical protein H4Q26_018176 [Puccinia striiformis f. sp. tritici PST-130]|nr:hypothetical protein H4Q26_018176 [Puccinia striiformis f. sp. tritici PST-130]
MSGGAQHAETQEQDAPARYQLFLGALKRLICCRHEAAAGNDDHRAFGKNQLAFRQKNYALDKRTNTIFSDNLELRSSSQRFTYIHVDKLIIEYLVPQERPDIRATRWIKTHHSMSRSHRPRLNLLLKFRLSRVFNDSIFDPRLLCRESSFARQYLSKALCIQLISTSWKFSTSFKTSPQLKYTPPSRHGISACPTSVLLVLNLVNSYCSPAATLGGFEPLDRRSLASVQRNALPSCGEKCLAKLISATAPCHPADSLVSMPHWSMEIKVEQCFEITCSPVDMVTSLVANQDFCARLSQPPTNPSKSLPIHSSPPIGPKETINVSVTKPPVTIEPLPNTTEPFRGVPYRNQTLAPNSPFESASSALVFNFHLNNFHFGLLVLLLILAQ